jgi:hypothetical protein
MTVIERYLAELGDALSVRGVARRRFLRECRDHLIDAAAVVGEEAAVRAFGPASEIAGAFDLEAGARLAGRSTVLSVVGVLATGGSTLALIDMASPGATAPGLLAVSFFVCAQVAAVATMVALLQALVLRRSAMMPAELLLLSRRNGCALVAAGLTMLSAGVALPGRGSAALLMAGPLGATLASVAVLRARRFARRLDRTARLIDRPPLGDLATLLGATPPALADGRLLTLTTVGAAAAAFFWAHGDGTTSTGALGAAGIEGAAVVVCFIAFGPALGLRRRGSGAPSG